MELDKVIWTPTPELKPDEERHINCFQKTLSVFAERMGLEPESALNMGVYYGGGMRHGGICGPANAGLLILGWFFGADAANADVGREYLEAFAKANASWLCSDIRDDERKNCAKAIDWAIAWLSEKTAGI